MLEQVCCILANGPEADILRLDFKKRASIYDKDFELVIYSTDTIPFGCSIYVCPFPLTKEIMGIQSGLNNTVIAYGPPNCLPLAVAAGAVDYMREDWDVEEFHFRCKKLLRRSNKELSWGSVFANGFVSKINGFNLELTPSEHRFFQLLVENAGKILPQNALLKAIGMSNVHSRILSIYCSKLRKSIAAFCPVAAKDVLYAVYAKGYLLQA